MARLLLLDDDPVILRILQSMAAKHGHETITASSVRQALKILQHDPYVDVIITDIVMPNATAWDLLRIIQKDQHLKDVPVILCSSTSDPETLVEARRAGACDFIVKPFTAETLISKVEKAMRGGRRTVLLVEDEAIVRNRLKVMLEVEGFRVNAVETAADALEQVVKSKIDVIVADIGLVGMTGIELASLVKRRLPSMPVLLITGLSERSTREMAASCGADGYLCKPFRNTDIANKINFLLSRNLSPKQA